MVKVGTATFIERDEAILREAFELKVFVLASRGWSFVWSCLRCGLWLIRHAWSADLFFTRFAHYHAFLLALAGKVFRKKVVIVVGGSDAIWIPRYRYGVYDHWLSRRTTRWALRWATLIIPNHASLIKGVNTFSDDEPRAEGLLEYTPDLRTPITTIHNGFDPGFWRPEPGVPRERMVLEVAPATTWTVFMTKGLDLLLGVAERLPDVAFTLVGVEPGMAEHWTGRRVPSNVSCLPKQTAEQLRSLYCRASVFAHFTLTEGMPNVLCEAMLCECVPVGSNVNSLPDIIGDTGVIVHRREMDLLVRAVQEGLLAGTGAKARQRIVARYPLERRRRELTSTLLHLIQR